MTTVPDKFDVLINSKGYMFDRRQEVQCEMTYTPTFLQRTNVSGAYGDNEQDFFLTVAQKDFSGGDGQLFYRDNEVQRNRYYSSLNVNPSHEGEIRMLQDPTTLTPAASVIATTGDFGSIGSFFTTSASTYSNSGSSITGAAAHGAGTPVRWGMCHDGRNFYVSGSSKIRKSTDMVTFTDFCATGNQGAIVYHNNQIYSCDGATLRVYSSAGAGTDLYLWNDALGALQATGTGKAQLISAGPKLYIFFPRAFGDRPELWVYDGTSTNRVAVLPKGYGGEAVESAGIIYITAEEIGLDDPNGSYRGSAVVYAFADGNLQELWRDDLYIQSQWPPSSTPAIAAFGRYLAVAKQDSSENYLVFLNLITGASHRVCVLTQASPGYFSMVNAGQRLHIYPNAANAFVWSGSMPTTASFLSSLFDFDNSLTKNFRSIKVEWVPLSTGGAVDLYYRVGDTTGTYTLLQTSAVSGTEYLLSGVTGRSISVKLVLSVNGGATPIVKRIYVRAAPTLQSYRRGVYLLDCSGPYKGKTPVMQRNNAPIGRSGAAMLAELVTALQTTSVSVTDELGTYTGALDPENFKAQRVGPNQYLVQVIIREV